jgi:hypothetical protein
MLRIQDGFVGLLKGFNLGTLENDPNPIFGLSSDLTINYLNPAWFMLAEHIYGESALSSTFAIGSPVSDSLSGPVRDFYLEAFRAVLESGSVRHHDYECSNPLLFSLFHQSVYPLHNRGGLVIVSSPVTEHPHEPHPPHPVYPATRTYVQGEGLITQCCNCMRVQHSTTPSEWHWVPAWIRSMPDNTSHTFCQICLEYYYESKG